MKCATTTLYEALLPKGEFIQPGRYGAVGGPIHPVPTERLADIHWSVCRNPYDRAVSIWASSALRNEADKYWVRETMNQRGGDWRSFKDFVRLILLMDPKPRVRSLFEPQSMWHDHAYPHDKVVPIENLENEVKEIIGEDVRLSKKNTSVHDNWVNYIDDEVAQLVEEWAAEDFKRFGYPLMRRGNVDNYVQ